VKIRAHKVASAVHRLGLGRKIEIEDSRRAARDGDVVAVRAEAEKRVYGELELADGRMAKIFRGDVIVGALGARRALKGFVGQCPEELGPGDALAILNLGGVIGVPEAMQHPDLGAPCPVRFLGFVTGDEGRTLSVADTGIKVPREGPLPSLVVVSGTCMASGKTRAACEIIHELASTGKRINGAKLTGVACRRDLLVMEDHGARRTASFLELGLVSTVRAPDMAQRSRGLLRHLGSDEPDAVVLELGDGILGEYGVLDVLRDIKDTLRVHVVCATDPVGAWGAREYLAREGIRLDMVSGPCTDSVVGLRFVEESLGVPAVNACTAPHRLGELVASLLERNE
jgi:hypothetical protein